jgi:hypothetical protein
VANTKRSQRRRSSCAEPFDGLHGANLKTSAPSGNRAIANDRLLKIRKARANRPQPAWRCRSSAQGHEAAVESERAMVVAHASARLPNTGAAIGTARRRSNNGHCLSKIKHPSGRRAHHANLVDDLVEYLVEDLADQPS